MSAAEQLLTWTSLGTMAGATGATFVVPNALRLAFGWSPKWVGLIVAQTICVGAAFAAGKEVSEYLLAILNGCLVFCSAAGVANITGEQTNVQATAKGSQSDKSAILSGKRFLGSWF